MKLALSGFEREVEISQGVLTTLVVENQTLFARVCQSLYSELGDEALEPYTIRDDSGKKIRPDKAFLFAFNPFDLPWTDRVLMKGLYAHIEDLLLSNESMRESVEVAANKLSDCIEGLGLVLQSDYAFDIEWNIEDHLKAFDFEVEVDKDDTLLDNLIKFMKLAEDASFDGIICFANLKSFLSENELQGVAEQVFLSDLRVLLLEGSCEGALLRNESRSLIDQDFLQY